MLTLRLREDGLFHKALFLTTEDENLLRSDLTLDGFREHAEKYPDHKWSRDQVKAIAGLVLYLLQVDDTDTDEALLSFLLVAGKSLMRDRPRCTLKTEPEVTDTFLPAIQGRINLS